VAHDGFTLYDAGTMKPILEFTTHKLETLYNAKVNRGNLLLRHLAVLFKTSIYGMVFEDKPNKVEFYDVDLQQIQANAFETEADDYISE